MQAPVYNFGTIAVNGNPEVHFKRLKRLVAERGFCTFDLLVPNQIPPVIECY